MPATTDEFAETLVKAKSGDAEAINSLLATYRPDIRQWIENECGHRTAQYVDVSGVTQNALLCIHRELAQFRGLSQNEFLTWIKRISMNRLIDEIRHNCSQKRNMRDVRSLETIDRPGLGQFAGNSSTPSVKASRNEQLTDAIAKLPVEQRAIATARFVEKAGIEAIAASCRVSPDEAALLLERAVRNLRKHLRQQV
jgi:RNA polymerase sigma-70 factor (ECF subfamily)